MFLLFEGKKVAKGKDKTKEEKLRPSDDKLRDAICQILKEVDFNTVSIDGIFLNKLVNMVLRHAYMVNTENIINVRN